MRVSNIEALFNGLNRQLQILCNKIKDVDPKHKLANGSWYVSHFFEDEICIAMVVDYPERPSMSLLPVTLTDEGIEPYVADVAWRNKCNLVREHARSQYEKDKRREEYLKLKEEFGDL